MAGKITYKAGTHSSRDGEWVTPVTLSEAQVLELGEILERDLTDAECRMITGTLSDIQGFRSATAGDAVSHQDIVETLKAIAKAGDGEVLQAYKDCDDTTESLIQDAINYDMQINSSNWHPPERICAAATLALFNLGSGKAGPRTKAHRSEFAKGVLRLWSGLGRSDVGIWEADGQASALVRFARELLKIIESKTCPSLSIVAKLLRKVSA
ncbi:MAG: hypothetical protein NT159_05680 [Proteobacteria bacterium]|nr:hypothetical protein [Pseudomonadota bacterium]